MRIAALVSVAVAISACVSPVASDSSASVAEIAMATESQCDQPGVRLDAVRLVGASEALELPIGSNVVSVRPGRYEVAVACQNPISDSRGVCVFWGHPNEYPTYTLKLRAGVRYTFHCYELGSDVGYRISESAR